MLMLAVSLFLVLLPVLARPGPSLAAFGMILLGIPVYVCLVMDTPFKIRPAFLDRLSGESGKFDLMLL